MGLCRFLTKVQRLEGMLAKIGEPINFSKLHKEFHVDKPDIGDEIESAIKVAMVQSRACPSIRAALGV